MSARPAGPRDSGATDTCHAKFAIGLHGKDDTHKPRNQQMQQINRSTIVVSQHCFYLAILVAATAKREASAPAAHSHLYMYMYILVI